MLGGFDLDPASSHVAQRTVRATRYFTAAENGLTQPWHGRVWLNPPYAAGLVDRFMDKLLAELARDVRAAIVLVNNATETAWAQRLMDAATALCFPTGRVRFLDADGQSGSPLQGQMVAYLGADDQGRFRREFHSMGKVWVA